MNRSASDWQETIKVTKIIAQFSQQKMQYFEVNTIRHVKLGYKHAFHNHSKNVPFWSVIICIQYMSSTVLSNGLLSRQRLIV